MISPELAKLTTQMREGRPAFEAATVLERRERMAHLFAPKIPVGVKVETLMSLDGALQVTPPDFNESRPVVFWVHGGGFTSGSPSIASGTAAQFAEISGLRVIIPAYRLAPENPYPAGLDDIRSAWGVLSGTSAKATFVIFGESAGANLALSLLQSLGSAQMRKVRAAVFVSGVFDLTNSGPSLRSNVERELLFAPSFFEEMRRHYALGQNWAQPDISPIFGRFENLPPLQFLVSTGEMLLDDTLRVAQKAINAQVRTEIVAWPDMPHAWPVFARAFPEATDGLVAVGDFIRRMLAERR